MILILLKYSSFVTSAVDYFHFVCSIDRFYFRNSHLYKLSIATCSKDRQLLENERSVRFTLIFLMNFNALTSANLLVQSKYIFIDCMRTMKRNEQINSLEVVWNILIGERDLFIWDLFCGSKRLISIENDVKLLDWHRSWHWMKWTICCYNNIIIF